MICLPWYQPGSVLMKCSGDDGCGALVPQDGVEQHTRWHERIEMIYEVARMHGAQITRIVKGV